MPSSVLSVVEASGHLPSKKLPTTPPVPATPRQSWFNPSSTQHLLCPMAHMSLLSHLRLTTRTLSPSPHQHPLPSPTANRTRHTRGRCPLRVRLPSRTVPTRSKRHLKVLPSHQTTSATLPARPLTLSLSPRSSRTPRTPPTGLRPSWHCPVGIQNSRFHRRMHPMCCKRRNVVPYRAWWSDAVGTLSSHKTIRVLHRRLCFARHTLFYA